MKHPFLTLSLLAVPLLFAGHAQAQGALSAADRQFVMQAAAGGMAEVEAGQLAATKTENAKVKMFAEHMVQDHTANNEALTAVAQQQGITLPTSTDAAHAAQIAKLRAESGSAFDQDYIAAQVAGHEAMAKLMQTEISGGSNAEVKAFAQKTLPTVQQHLMLAKQLSGNA